MVNAPYSSRANGGTKQFQLEGNTFGWQAVVDLYLRECERRNKGAARSVPRLREVHVLRDSWTKLNVHPAKIMQVIFLCSIHLWPSLSLNSFSKKRYWLNCTRTSLRTPLLWMHRLWNALFNTWQPVVSSLNLGYWVIKSISERQGSTGEHRHRLPIFCELVSITYPMDDKTLHYVVTVIMPQISSEILQR